MACGKSDLTDSGEARLLLIVDQLEELFTHPSIGSEQREILMLVLDNLAHCGKVWVVATMRSNFIDDLVSSPLLASLSAGEARYLLAPPDVTELADIIRRPAQEAGLRYSFDDAAGIGLDDVLLQATSQNRNALPLLEFALDQLWQKSGASRLIDFAAYDALGGLNGAIGQRADEVMNELSEDVKSSFPLVLRALVTVGQGDGAMAAARTVPLDRFPPGSFQRELVEAFLAPDARLLVVDGDGSGTWLRVVHEALLTHWPRAHRQIAADRADLQLRARIEAYEMGWRQAAVANQDDLLIPAGKPLSDAEDLLTRRRDELDSSIVDFIGISSRKRHATARRELIRLRAIAAILAVLTILAGIGGWMAWDRSQEADRQRDVAEQKSREANENAEEANRQRQVALTRASEIAEQKQELKARLDSALTNESRFLAQKSDDARKIGKFDMALGAALSALPVSYDEANERPVVDVALMATNRAVAEDPAQGILRGHKWLVTIAKFSPDGMKVLTGSHDGMARIWDSVTGQLLATMGSRGNVVFAANFSPDGSRVVTSQLFFDVRVWDTTSGHMVANLDGHRKKVESVEFSSDGAKIITASDDMTARIWDALTGKIIITLEGHSGSVNYAIFSPDNLMAFTVSDDKTARIWDAVTGKCVAVLEGHTGAVNSVAVSPDGAMIATSSKDGTARLWDAVTGQNIAILNGHAKSINSVKFSPVEKLVLTASDDNTAKLWSAVDGSFITTFQGHTSSVYSANFKPDGTSVVTASYDNSVRTWYSPAGIPISTFIGHTNYVNSAEFSPNGVRVVSASWDGTARLWDASEGHNHNLRGPFLQPFVAPDLANLITLTESGRIENSKLLNGAVITWKGSIQLPRRASPDKTMVADPIGKEVQVRTVFVREPISVLVGHSGPVSSVEFSNDGTRLVTASEDSTAMAWDSITGSRLLVLKGHARRLISASFSSDGTKIVTTSNDNTARIWDAKSGEEKFILSGHNDVVIHGEFSPDGRKVVTTSGDKTIRVWDTDTGKLLQVLIGHSNGIGMASFNPDGRRVVSASRDDSRIWDVETGQDLGILEEKRSWITLAWFNPGGDRAITIFDNSTARVRDVTKFLTFDKILYYAPLVSLRDLTNDEKNELRLPSVARPEAERHPTDRCDEVAAHPLDPMRHGRGVQYSELKADVALAACRSAIEKGRDVARMRYQYGRALQKARRGDEAKAAYQAAADEGYPMGWFGLSRQDSDAFFKRPSAALWQSVIKNSERAYSAGVLAAGWTLSGDLWRAPAPHGDRAVAIDWAKRAAAAGSPQANDWLADRYILDDGVEKDIATSLFHRAIAAKLFRQEGDDDEAERAAAQRGTLARSMPVSTVIEIGGKILQWKSKNSNVASPAVTGKN